MLVTPPLDPRSVRNSRMALGIIAGLVITSISLLYARHRLKHRADVLYVTLQRVESIEHLLLGRLEDTVKPPQDHERQDDAAVLRLLVVTT